LSALSFIYFFGFSGLIAILMARKALKEFWLIDETWKDEVLAAVDLYFNH
jgi:hypothetical protein